jgi:hypothetical protein
MTDGSPPVLSAPRRMKKFESASRPGDRAEHELLLRCARTNSTEQNRERIHQLASTGIDWSYFFQIARRHSVVPLVYRQLQQHAPTLIPGETLRTLKLHYQENSARNTVLTAELCRLIKRLAAAGIDAIPYKGPVLAVVAYGNVALRRFVDLDIMVRKEDVIAARDVLLDEGYELSKSLTATQQEVLLRTQHNMQFTSDNRLLIVELHWEVASHLFASSVQADDLWSNLDSIDIDGTEMKTLSVDDLLFSLCVHGSRHLWERLGWICDIAELIARHQLSWQRLMARAIQADSERMFLLGLCLAEKLLDAELPADIKDTCDDDDRLQSLAQNIVDQLFNGTEHVPATSREIFNYNIGVRKSLGARLRYVLYMLRPTDSDLGSHSLPRSLRFGYYLMRPVRLFFKERKGA